MRITREGGTPMMGFCPHCEKRVELEKTIIEEVFVIRGEEIKVATEYLKCVENGHLMEDPKSDEDSIDDAYRIYREIHNMLQPEDIVEIRSRYGLTQRDLSSLLGWGGATLSRYENGALQSASHDNLLRLVAEPENLRKLLEDKEGELSEQTYRRLSELLHTDDYNACPSMKNHFISCFTRFDPDANNGYRRLSVDKLENAFLFFCRESPVVKTKMNKLLFYADFKHYREYGTSITGAPYARLPYGPAPHLYELLIAFMLLEEKSITIEEKVFGDFLGEACKALRDPDISQFSSSELNVLAEVAQLFSSTSATAISDLSHDEAGYQNTSNGQLISYEYAEALQI